MLDKAFDDDSDKNIKESSSGWDLYLSIEDNDRLNATYYFEFTNELKGECVNATFYCGIDVGSELIEYDLDGSSGVPLYKKVESFKDIEIDWSKVAEYLRIKGSLNWDEEISETRKGHILQIFNYHKPEILKQIQNQSYDDYFTGGGTCKTGNYYAKLREKWEDMGLYYKKIYETIEVEPNIR